MASSTLGIGNNYSFVRDHAGKWSCVENRCNNWFVAMNDQSRSRGGRKGIRIAATTTASLEPYWKKSERNDGDGVDAMSERLDKWMKESVVEIVKNLGEAPLLVQVYDPKAQGGGDRRTTAAEEEWPAVMEKWEKGETPLPEGVILVEELAAEEGEEERTTKAWGIVVQGRGVGSSPVCYLLKTSRVGSGSGGIGMCGSTHFCLIRVNSFRETLKSQLKNCWLLQGH